MCTALYSRFRRRDSLPCQTRPPSWRGGAPCRPEMSQSPNEGSSFFWNFCPFYRLSSRIFSSQILNFQDFLRFYAPTLQWAEAFAPKSGSLVPVCFISILFHKKLWNQISKETSGKVEIELKIAILFQFFGPVYYYDKMKFETKLQMKWTEHDKFMSTQKSLQLGQTKQKRNGI